MSITAPDLRRLAARAGQKQGPGGVRITTPPQSGLSPVDFKKIPGVGLGTPGGGAICTFAFELFFIVAFFLFLLFLPIVVLAFQLWWMLALRFCIPPSIAFNAVAQFFAEGHLLIELTGGANLDMSLKFDEVMGFHDAATELLKPLPPDNRPSDFQTEGDRIGELVTAMGSKGAQLTPVPPDLVTTPPDPLCPQT